MTTVEEVAPDVFCGSGTRGIANIESALTALGLPAQSERVTIPQEHEVHVVMQLFRVAVGLSVVGLALAVGGCGSGGEVGSGATDIAEVAATTPLPDRVVVHQPGYVDIGFSADDVPVWPGPDPYEFLEPSPPSGLSGEITGERAEAVYAAALDNPGDFWNVGGIVRWLVVDPL
ncbi:hypothetical protein [Prescottella equi]